MREGSVTGDGRNIQLVVLGAVATLILALCVIVVIGILQNKRSLLEAVGVATVPPPDVSRANSPPRGNIAQSFGPDSYPDDARDAGRQGLVRAALRVAATGRVDNCWVTRSSGSASLDRRTCEIALANVRFDPARDERGAAIASTYDLRVRWVLPAD